MVIIYQLIEDLPEAMMQHMHKQSQSTGALHRNNTLNGTQNVEKSLLSSLGRSVSKTEDSSSLLYDIWFKVTLSFCLVIIVFSLLLAFQQFYQQFHSISYRIIPSDDFSRVRQVVPDTISSNDKETNTAYSGVNLPFMVVSDI